MSIGQDDIPFFSQCLQNYGTWSWWQAEKELSNLGAHSKQRNDFIALISVEALAPSAREASPRVTQAWQQEREVTLTHTKELCPSKVGNHNQPDMTKNT